jgi:Putative restriction endonuclease
MDPSRASQSALSAPGSVASSGAAYAPGRHERLPAVDERLVAPESHTEILDGRVIRTMGSNQPHGMRHFEATGLFFSTLADGFAGAVDMLTRLNEDSDAAPDISVFPSAPDATTGGRQLEEIAVEVLDTERMSHATNKIEKLALRGVRRLFAIRVASRTVYEWDHAHGDWTELAADAVITDRCFRVPIPARALVDRVLADDTVARAMLASGNRVISAALDERREAGLRDGREAGLRDGREGGLEEGARASLLRVFSRRGLSLSAAQHERVQACGDIEVLHEWLDCAVDAATADDVLGG